MQAFSKIRINLKQIQLFYTERGNEFKNKQIDEILKAFKIEGSFSVKGWAYDNAVAEATYKIIKTEFINQRTFSSLDQLKIELADYVNWFNNHRIHSSLNYLTPREFEKNTLKKVVKKVLTIQPYLFYFIKRISAFYILSYFMLTFHL